MKKKKLCPLQALILICNNDEKLERLAHDILLKYGIAHELIHHATGTASSSILDMLGVGTSAKMVLSAFIPSDRADEIMSELNLSLRLEEKNKGLAFTLPITGMASNIMEELEINYGRK